MYNNNTPTLTTTIKSRRKRNLDPLKNYEDSDEDEDDHHHHHNDNNDRLRTPLLQLFCTYCNLLGVQFTPVHAHRPTTWFSLVWNTTLLSTVLYGLLTGDLVGTQAAIRRAGCTHDRHAHRPLFHHLLFLSTRVIFPAIFATGMGYFLPYGRTVLRLMDAAPFRKHFRGARKTAAIFVAVLTANLTIFATFLWFKSSGGGNVSGTETASLLPETFLAHLCALIVGFYQYAMCFVVHYYQHATYRALSELAGEVAIAAVAAGRETAETRVLRKVRTLAALNRRLNRALSTPALLYLVLHVFNVALNTTVLALCKLATVLLVHSALIWLYLVYLVALNHAVVRKLAKIVDRLEASLDAERREKRVTNSQWKFEPEEKLLDSRRIRLEQFRWIYPHCFRLNWFEAVQLRLRTLTAVGLLVLNYVVLITQTN